MLKEIPIEESIGKSLARICSSVITSQTVMVFSDGTFTTLEVKHEYDCHCRVVGAALKLFDFGDRKLVESGILTYEEIDELRRKRQEGPNVTKTEPPKPNYLNIGYQTLDSPYII